MSDQKDLCNEKYDREGEVRPVTGSKMRHWLWKKKEAGKETYVQVKYEEETEMRIGKSRES